MKAMFLLADLPSHSLECLYDKESNREQFLNSLKAGDIFLKVTALASAVKIDESSGIRCILLW